MREKKKQPKQKQAIEVKDLAQPNGLEVWWGVAPPSPKKMVLPVMVAQRCAQDIEIIEDGRERAERTGLHGHKSPISVVYRTVD